VPEVSLYLPNIVYRFEPGCISVAFDPDLLIWSSKSFLQNSDELAESDL